MNRFLIRSERTQESSDFFVDAPCAEDAADLYLRQILAEQISVDLEEVMEGETLDVVMLPATSASTRLIPWEQLDGARCEIRISDLPCYPELARVMEGETPALP